MESKNTPVIRTIHSVKKKKKRLQVKTVAQPASCFDLCSQVNKEETAREGAKNARTRWRPPSWRDAHFLCKRQPEHESASPGRSIPGAQTYLRLWIEGTMVACVLSQSRLCSPRRPPMTKHHGAAVEISHTGLFPFSETTLFLSSLIATAL